MSVFKVGDRVRVISPGLLAGSDQYTSSLEPSMTQSFVPLMESTIGKEGIITEVTRGGYFIPGMDAEYGWMYLPEWLELVDPANPVD